MRYIVKDKQGLHRGIKNHYSTLPEGTIELIDEDTFFNLIQTSENNVFLAYGRKIYDKLLELHRALKIHIGLRKFTYASFTALPSIHIGKNVLVFGTKPSVDEDVLVDSKYTYFLSDGVEGGHTFLPETICVGLKEGTRIIETVFMPDKTTWVGLDFETAGFPEDEDFRISGFALSLKDTAYFFDFRKDFDYDESKQTPDSMFFASQFMIKFKQYMDTHAANVWAYNCAFEMMVLYRMYQRFYYIQDAYALTTADDQKHSLKYNVQYYLHAPSWNDTLSTEQAYIKAIRAQHPTFASFKSALYFCLDQEDNVRQVLDPKEKLPQTYIDACEFYVQDVKNNNGHLFNLLSNYWDEYSDWYACDPEKLGVYCCYDAFYGVKLAEKLFPAYGSNCYPVFLFNKYLGMELKMSGIKVDVEKATKYAKYCQNICSNYEILLNKIFLRSYMKQNKWCTIEIPKQTLRIIAEYPEVCQADPMKITKILLGRLCPKKPDWNIPSTFLNDMFGYDVSDEVSSVLDEEAMSQGLDSYTRKKKTAEPIGKFIQTMIHLSELVESFNRFIVADVYIALKEYIKNAGLTYMWSPLQKYIRMEDAWIAIDVARAWYKKYGTKIEAQTKRGKKDVTVTLYDTLCSRFKKVSIDLGVTTHGVAEDIPENNLRWLLEEVHNEVTIFEPKKQVSTLAQVYDLRDLDDDYYLQFDLSTIVPKAVAEEFDGITHPEISAYRYLRLRACAEEITRFDEHIRVTEDPFVGTIYEGRDKLYFEKVCKYSSNDQFPEIFGAMLKHEYRDNYLVMYSTWQYIKANNVERTPEKIRELLTVFESKIDLLNQSDALDLFMPEVEIGSYYSREEGGRVSIMKREPAVWKKEFISDGVTFAEEYFQYLFDEPRNNMTTELPDDTYQLLAKLGFLTDFASVASKELNTYLKNILNGKHKIFYPGVHSGYFSDNGPKDTYVPTFAMNTLATKRCTSGYHTFLPHSDTMKCLIVEPGRIKTYFDVSQMEPRSICYISHDPVFMDIYNSGKDAYMELAKITWPDHVNDPDFKAKYRGIAKTCMISSIYGQGDAGLAARAGVTTERVTEMKRAMFGTWREVDRLRQHKLHYLQQTGEIETFLGDRLHGDKDDAFTTAVNYGNQGNASVVANEGFELSIMNIRALDIDVSAESVIHDSNQNNLPIRDLFEADICYRNYFRKYIFEKYGIDFKYDLDILYNSCEHMSYSLDVETMEGKISGPKGSVDYVFTYLTEPDITILEDEITDNPDKGLVDPIGEFIKNPTGGPRAKPHYICDYPEFLSPYIRTVKFKVNRHVRGIETATKPLGIPSYFDKVKRWDEHLIPGMEDDEEKAQNKQSLHIRDNPSKIYPVDIANKLLAG